MRLTFDNSIAFNRYFCFYFSIDLAGLMHSMVVIIILKVDSRADTHAARYFILFFCFFLFFSVFRSKRTFINVLTHGDLV